MNTWNIRWKDQWKKTIALGSAAFLLGSSAAYAASSVTQADGRANVARVQDAPMPLPLTEEEISAQQLADAEYMALLWMRTSAEYRALCYQGYNAALMAIDRAQANPAARSGKPLAIVLDCDETVTDNTRAMAASVAGGNGRFDALWWRATVHEGRSEALPGAAEFLREVVRRGVAIFYVSNRWSEVNYEPTIENLTALGFPSVDAEHVLLMEDRQMSDKQPRFDRITADYDVVVYMGDNAGDLPLGTKGMNLAARNAAIDAAREEFGTTCIVFPNPAYGSWVSALAKDYMTMTPEAREAFYEKMLTKHWN
ncbi:5'-nucleotidase, lipoprotein e(P4) family [Selenomonas dianae]|uniref:5'-nucleotidase, lipoprotein e(P4) family n=1 Tax=Selenomonas dianae TaxID=135079 RepID=A0ABP3CSM4_9FIRM|nr:HAD family acid phosphatase [Selenomonas dianae]WLD82426.1 HAD family acid phosphatase [Selenomonas dianae]